NERGPRPEAQLRRPSPPRRRRAGRSDRPRFNNDERGPRREGGGFGGGDRPRFNDRNERGPRPERSFGDRPRREDGGAARSDRPSFNQDRGPRPERSFGDRKPGFGKGPRKDGGDRGGRESQGDRSFQPREGEERRSLGGIRTYRAPASLKGKAAPVKVIRREEDDQ
ncbi:hypothetical protein PV794_17840, partial [Comamonas aquatica]|nr:hypothetical protein [Comamonas aquatica]